MLVRSRFVVLALCAVLVVAVAACQPAKKAPPGPKFAGVLYYLNDTPAPGGNKLWVLDTATAARTEIGPSIVTGGDVGLSEGPDANNFFCSTPVDLCRQPIDGSAATNIGGDQQEGLAWDATNNVLYGDAQSTFHTIDPSTGLNGPALAVPPADAEGLAWRQTDGRIYGTGVDGNLYAYTIGTNTWALIGATGLSNPDNSGLAWDPLLDVFYALARDGNLYRVDPASGAGTLIGNTGLARGGGLAFRVVQIA